MEEFISEEQVLIFKENLKKQINDKIKEKLEIEGEIENLKKKFNSIFSNDENNIKENGFSLSNTRTNFSFGRTSCPKYGFNFDDLENKKTDFKFTENEYPKYGFTDTFDNPFNNKFRFP